VGMVYQLVITPYLHARLPFLRERFQAQILHEMWLVRGSKGVREAGFPAHQHALLPCEASISKGAISSPDST
jgi:hypothetical protein